MHMARRLADGQMGMGCDAQTELRPCWTLRHLRNRGRLIFVLCRKGEAMKRIILALTFLLATSSVASAQFTPGKENLRGLTGVRLIVMFDRPTRAEALDEVKRPGVLKMFEDDTKAKLEKAGIPFSRSQFADEIGKDYG